MDNFYPCFLKNLNILKFPTNKIKQSNSHFYSYCFAYLYSIGSAHSRDVIWLNNIIYIQGTGRVCSIDTI